MTPEIAKYPRTAHLEGSRLQPGDRDLSQAPFSWIRGRHVVVEEKVDGANVAVSFDGAGELLLQSRGHYLSGGDHRHYDPLKAWARVHADAFLDVLSDRYVMYGEWCYAVHSEFYDLLPHYFLEFDVLDRETGAFLSTERRRALLAGLPVVPAPVLAARAFGRIEELTRLVGRSLYKSDGWRSAFDAQARRAGVDPVVARGWIDDSDLAEGLYLKVEKEGRVVERLKWVRADFLQAIAQSGGHWAERPIVANLLAAGVDLYAPGAGR